MRRLFIVATIALVSASAATSAQAEWLHRIFQSGARDFKRNNCWPEPFVQADRQAVITPLGMMIAKGWTAQATLSSHHFREDGNELNEAGRMKVRWILTEVPPQFRTIQVDPAENPETTAERIAVVQTYLSDFADESGVPDVVAARRPAKSWSADYINSVTTKFRDTTPAPRIPESDEESSD